MSRAGDMPAFLKQLIVDYCSIPADVSERYTAPHIISVRTPPNRRVSRRLKMCRAVIKPAIPSTSKKFISI